MTIRLLKFTIAFVISFFILSVPVNNRSIYSHLSRYTSSYTDNLFKTVNRHITSSIRETKKLGRKLFSNANPETVDTLESIRSSNKKINRTVHINKMNNAHGESYSDDEMEQLESLLVEQ